MRERYTPAGAFRRTPEERADQELFHPDPRPRARAYLDRFPPSPDA
ncbi:hypothetical protein [Kribbella pittospori]|nr:hypothetical protein [Kribbella pittospori]